MALIYLALGAAMIIAAIVKLFWKGDCRAFGMSVGRNATLPKIGAALILPVALIVAFVNRDIEVRGEGGWGVFIGKVESIEYYGRFTTKSNYYRQTLLKWTNGIEVNLCGDQSSNFSPGNSYRIDEKAIEWGPHDGFEMTCERIINAEELSKQVNVGELTGQIISVTRKQDDYYKFTVELEDSSRRRSDLPLCDDPIGPTDTDASRLLAHLQGSTDFHELTIFYNKGDKSKHYGCFPIIVVRGEKDGLLLRSQNAILYYPDEKELLARFRVPMPAAQRTNQAIPTDAGLLTPQQAGTTVTHLSPSQIRIACKLVSTVPMISVALDAGEPDQFAAYDCGSLSYFVLVGRPGPPGRCFLRLRS